MRKSAYLSSIAKMVAETGAIHLSALVQPEGKFIYQYSGRGAISKEYNLLRHCGTAWSMCEVAIDCPGLETVIGKARTATDWLLQNRTTEFGGGLCVVEDDQSSKLGGAGLAILVCVSLADATGDTRYLDWAEGFARFVRFMQRGDDDFHHKISIETEEVANFRSDYYTGEALFGVARLLRYRRDDAFESFLAKCLGTLEANDYGVETSSHWMLYAIAEHSLLTGEDTYFDYAQRIAEFILCDSSYRQRRESTPIACRSEALLAFLQMAKQLDKLGQPIIPNILDAAQKNLTLQLTWRRPAGGFVKGENSEQHRIDYTQHNVFSFLAFGRFGGH